MLHTEQRDQTLITTLNSAHAAVPQTSIWSSGTCIKHGLCLEMSEKRLNESQRETSHKLYTLLYTLKWTSGNFQRNCRYFNIIFPLVMFYTWINYIIQIISYYLSFHTKKKYWNLSDWVEKSVLFSVCRWGSVRCWFPSWSYYCVQNKWHWQVNKCDKYKDNNNNNHDNYKYLYTE